MTLKLIRIFISHTSDTNEECQIAKNIILQESQLHYEKKGYKLEPFCWDDIRRGAGDPQEDLIDPHIKDDKCKLIVMILWSRFGSPTKKHESGIEHEYNVIKKNNKNILIFFSNKNVRPFSIEPQQLEKVQKFKRIVEYERYCGHCGFFENLEDFQEKVRSQLVMNIEKIIQEERNLSEDFEAASRGF